MIEELRTATTRRKYLDYLFNLTRKRVRELEKIVGEIKGRLAKGEMTSEELADLWEEFDKVFMTVIPWFYIPWYVIEYNLITDRVKNKLNRHRERIEKMTGFNDALMILIFPTKKVLLQTEQNDFYELVRLARNKKNFEKNGKFSKLADKYLKRYAWTKTFLFLPIEPLTLRELVNNVKQAVKNNGIEEHKLQRNRQLENKKLAGLLIKTLNKDKELIKQIELARKFSWLLNWSVEKALIATAELIPFYKLIAKRLKIKYSRWVLLTYSEILEGLRNGLKVGETELKKREKGYVFLMEKGKSSMVTGLSAKKLAEDIDKNIIGENNLSEVITGQATSPGIIQGRVKIAMSAKDSHKLKQGNILVCSMTSPDYVPAMKRAAAIVTDEGGLLCHAAIVSRELGKPCVVGTRNASKLLKDGDLVEVDANKGIVMILKKAK